METHITGSLKEWKLGKKYLCRQKAKRTEQMNRLHNIENKIMSNLTKRAFERMSPVKLPKGPYHCCKCMTCKWGERFYSATNKRFQGANWILWKWKDACSTGDWKNEEKYGWGKIGKRRTGEKNTCCKVSKLNNIRMLDQKLQMPVRRSCTIYGRKYWRRKISMT